MPSGATMSTEILSTKPHPLKGLLPFGELKSQVAKLSHDELREIWATQFDPIRSNDPGWVRTLDHWVEQSLQGTDVATATLALGLLLGPIEVFVSNPVKNVAFLVLHSFWSI